MLGDSGRADLRLLFPALAGWAAVALALRLPAAIVLVAGLVAALVAARLLRRATLRRRTAAMVLATVGLLAVCAGLHGMARASGPIADLASERAMVSLTGRLSADPRAVRARSASRDDATSVVVRLQVSKVTGRGAQSRAAAPVVIFGDKRWSEFRWRDTVRVVGRLSPAEPQDDVVARLNPAGPPTRLGRPPPLMRGIESVRDDLRAATDPLPADARGLLPALLLGDVSRVPADLTDDMRATGMTHLTAVSGANVTIVLMAVLWACGWVRVPRRWRLPVCLTALGVFVLLCRPEPSVARAAVMGLVGLLATSVGRPRAAAPALGGAIVVLLCLDPWLATAYGFTLSVLATLGLVLFARTWGAWFADRLPARMRWLGEPLAIPVAAQVMCTPVVVLLQGAVPLVGVPANVLAAPLVAPATLGGVVTVVLAPVVGPAAALAAWVSALPAELIAQIAHRAARVPGGAVPWPDDLAGAVALAVITALVGLCGAWALARGRRHPVALVACAGLVLAAAWPLPQPGWPPAGWVFVSCDVGQGDGGVLRVAPGRVVLVDVGPDADGITRCLDDLGVTEVEAVVLTHFHADHVAGLSGVLGAYRVRQVVTTSVHGGQESGGERSLEPAVRRVVATARVPVVEVRRGDVLTWGSTRAEVLWPARTIQAGSVQNNGSVVLDVRVGGARVLLLGDAEQEAQAAVAGELHRHPDATPVDAVKVAHHGSGNHEPRLLRDLGAHYALISVGADNDYGHPAPRLLATLASAGSRVVRTDRHGDLAVVTGGRTAVVTRRG